jgi:hypothetical protein
VKQGTIHIPPESDTVEWKESLGEWKEIIETCAAFATARGVLRRFRQRKRLGFSGIFCYNSVRREMRRYFYVRSSNN